MGTSALFFFYLHCLQAIVFWYLHLGWVARWLWAFLQAVRRSLVSQRGFVALQLPPISYKKQPR
jgi:hypothetical protein